MKQKCQIPKLAVPEKLQTPSSKLQRNSKHQIPNTLAQGMIECRGLSILPATLKKCLLLEFGIWSFFGAWILELGSSIRLLLLVVLGHLRHAFLDFFAVFEIAADCAIPARDNFIALLQSLD